MIYLIFNLKDNLIFSLYLLDVKEVMLVALRKCVLLMKLKFADLFEVLRKHLTAHYF